MPRVTKPYRSMPESVASSAWARSPRWGARAITKLDDLVFWVALVSYFVPLVGAITIPIGALAQWRGASQTLVLVAFLAPALLCLVSLLFFMISQRLAVAVLVPRADRSYPLVSDMEHYTEHATEIAKKSVLPSIVYPFLAYAYSAPLSYWLWAAAATCVASGLGLWAYGRLNPTWGEVFPSKAEVEQKVKARRGADERESQQADEYPVPVEVRPARTTFRDIHGMRELKERMLSASKQILGEPRSETPRNGILLHGEPGNGKTALVEALAGELGVPVIQVTYGDVSSKWLGEMPKTISRIFSYAKDNAPCLLFVDEVDSFIRSRSGGSSNTEELKITNTLLTEIVNLRDYRVVLVAATNFLSDLDAAATRDGRFDFKIEVTPPDEEARIGLLTNAGAKYAGAPVDEAGTRLAAQRWAGFSVSRLLAVSKELPQAIAKSGAAKVGYAEWIAALRSVQGRKGLDASGGKSLADLVLVEDTRDALTLIAKRLKDVEKIHAKGGTLPTGVLFHGPSGTGKTAAARALAKECGWAFLAVAGPDLLADRSALDKLTREARDLRPALVFIDEADDLLRHRQYSGTPDLVNKLLVLMDGAHAAAPDVVYIAATNNPDQVDPALLRAGRFTEKVEFHPPAQEQVPKAIARWLKQKNVMLAPGLDVFDVAERLEGATIANIEGALQYALNRAITSSEGDGPVQLTEKDLAAAVRVVTADGVL